MPVTWNEQLATVFPDDLRYKNAKVVREPVPVSHNEWDRNPIIFTVKGKPEEFFTIGALGNALNRSPNTLRAWEKDGTIPRTPYTKPSDDPRGRRRLYPRGMVEGLMRIAAEEGIFYPDKGKKITDTRFTIRVQELFKRILKEHKG